MQTNPIDRRRPGLIASSIVTVLDWSAGSHVGAGGCPRRLDDERQAILADDAHRRAPLRAARSSAARAVHSSPPA